MVMRVEGSVSVRVRVIVSLGLRCDHIVVIIIACQLTGSRKKMSKVGRPPDDASAREGKSEGRRTKLAIRACSPSLRSSCSSRSC